MDLTQTLLDVIDLHSFSNIWFWIVLAVAWSSASHYVLGVPFDLMMRARRQGGEAQRNFEEMARISADRLLYIARTSGTWILAFTAFVLTALGLMAFHYWIEFAQALFLLAVPMTLLGFLSLRAARRIEAEGTTGEALLRRMTRHRLLTQIIGMVSIFVTALWGMYHNLSVADFLPSPVW